MNGLTSRITMGAYPLVSTDDTYVYRCSILTSCSRRYRSSRKAGEGLRRHPCISRELRRLRRGLLVDAVTVVAVQLVREELAGTGRIAGRKRHRLPVERHALQPLRRRVLEVDIVAEPGRQ